MNFADNNTAKYVAIAGVLFYVFAPHEWHMKYSPDWLLGLNFPHSTHILIGATLLLIGLEIIKW